MPASRPRVPSYRLHKPSGQAVVTIAGRDVYLGKHGTPGSRAEYDRLISEWMAAGRASVTPAPRSAGAPESDVSVAEILLAYLRFADGSYRKDGEPTREPSLLRLSFRPLHRLYGSALAREFGPLALKAVR